MSNLNLIEIADLARLIYSGYPEAASTLNRYKETLQSIRDHGMTEHEADTLHAYKDYTSICIGYSHKLGELSLAAAEQFPEIWGQLRMVQFASKWHEEPDFDWDSAIGELRRIEGAALNRRDAEVKDSLDTALPDTQKKHNAIHSADFRSVVWFGKSYSFTKNQAACVKVLWEAWENGTPELDGLTVIAQADSAGTRLIDIFRGHPAWGKMIVQGTTKGAYRLDPQEAKSPTSE